MIEVSSVEQSSFTLVALARCNSDEIKGQKITKECYFPENKALLSGKGAALKRSADQFEMNTDCLSAFLFSLSDVCRGSCQSEYHSGRRKMGVSPQTCINNLQMRIR
jgi:hypothetical protein